MYDVIIIGAGVVGASVARELSKYELSVAILESESDIAMVTSSANSAIVHAGYDCVPGTLMAELNVRGNMRFTELERDIGVPFKRIGSLVLAFTEEEMDELQELYERGVKNDVPGLKILGKNEILRFEPNVSKNVKAALYAPSAGITCPYQMTVALLENAVDNGVKLFLEHRVTNVFKDKDDAFFVVETEKSRFKSRYVINCAGLYSDEINKMAGAEHHIIHPRKGEYALYDKKHGDMVKTVLFQAPDKMGKGVLVTPTIDGNLLIGPNAVDIEDKDDKSTTKDGQTMIYKKALKTVPTLPRGDVIRTFAGIRAVTDIKDFVIQSSKKVKGFIYAIGICSPGLSAAPAIGEYISKKVEELDGCLKLKTNFKKTRNPIPDFSEMSIEDRNKYIKEDKRFGRVICRCEIVTEAEIIEALNRSVPVLTVDAVKRRTRAGMGRCQGGFCTPRILEIMSRELNIPVESITKRGGNSYIVLDKLDKMKIRRGDDNE